MAAVGADVTGSWFLSSGVAGFLVFLVLLLLLSVFVTTLCSFCNRHSFDLQHSGVDKDALTVIRVVKLEEVRENPMIDEIQNDEKQFRRDEENPVAFSTWRGHLGAPNTNNDMNHAPSPPDSAHTMAEGSDARAPAAANQEPEQLQRRPEADLSERNSVYARVSKKQNVKPEEEEEEEEEEEYEEYEEYEDVSPPLPDRTEMELWS